MSKLFNAAAAAATIVISAYAWAAEQRPTSAARDGKVITKIAADASTPKGDRLSVVQMAASGCTVVTVGIAVQPSGNREVTVDWKCVEEFADGDPAVSNGALMAIILKAVRDGKATSK